jgi:hypothetical protein
MLEHAEHAGWLSGHVLSDLIHVPLCEGPYALCHVARCQHPREQAQGTWAAQDLFLHLLAPFTCPTGSTLQHVPVLPQRFNGPCGLLTSVQAELLQQALGGS